MTIHHDSTPTSSASTAELGEIGPGRWIEHWDPENKQFWETKGKAIAFRNLIFSIIAEHIGFSIWLLWSVMVVKLLGTVDLQTGAVTANADGWALTANQGFTLLAVASGVGAFLRVPYTFAVPLFGGRNWTVISAFLLVIPTAGLAWAVSNPDISFGLLLAIAATAGFGGGNFASSMANITFFYPESEKGWALGLNAAGGNIGVAVAQKLVPVVIGIGGIGLAAAGLLYLPLAVIAGVLALLFMDNLREAKADPKPTVDSLKHGHTWVMAVLYIGTFGSFIGYSAAFPTLLTVAFQRPDIALQWGFLGALVGSLARPYGGKLADRIGGSLVTVVCFLAMAVVGYTAVLGVQNKSLGLFFASFILLFLFTGLGNGSTYRMIPSIFTRLSARKGDGSEASKLDFKRQSAGAVGIISAIGAFGGFAIPFVYKYAKAATVSEAMPQGTIVPALQIYVGVFLVMAVITWFFFLRKSSEMYNV